MDATQLRVIAVEHGCDFHFQTTCEIAKTLRKDDIITVNLDTYKRRAKIVTVVGPHVFCTWYDKKVYAWDFSQQKISK